MDSKKVDEIQSAIIDYLDDYMPILDDGVAAEDGDEENYNGVTIPYIKEYVLDDKYSREEVVYSIFDLAFSKKIWFFYCGDVADLVVAPGSSNYSIVNGELWEDYNFDGLGYNFDKCRRNNTLGNWQTLFLDTFDEVRNHFV